MLSSYMVKNVDTANAVLSAGIVTSMVSALKSGSGGSERERIKADQAPLRATYALHNNYCQ